jgi:hypothetical protein
MVSAYRCEVWCSGCSICSPEPAAPEPDTFDEACGELDARCDAQRAEAVTMMEAAAAEGQAA